MLLWPIFNIVLPGRPLADKNLHRTLEPMYIYQHTKFQLLSSINFGDMEGSQDIIWGCCSPRLPGPPSGNVPLEKVVHYTCPEMVGNISIVLCQLYLSKTSCLEGLPLSGLSFWQEGRTAHTADIEQRSAVVAGSKEWLQKKQLKAAFLQIRDNINSSLRSSVKVPLQLTTTGFTGESKYLINYSVARQWVYIVKHESDRFPKMFHDRW